MGRLLLLLLGPAVLLLAVDQRPIEEGSRPQRAAARQVAARVVAVSAPLRTRTRSRALRLGCCGWLLGGLVRRPPQRRPRQVQAPARARARAWLVWEPSECVCLLGGLVWAATRRVRDIQQSDTLAWHGMGSHVCSR